MKPWADLHPLKGLSWFSVVGREFTCPCPHAHINGTPLENGLPMQVVKAAEWVEWIDEDDEKIWLLDIGEGFLQGEELKKLPQPGTLRVLEKIFTDCFNYCIASIPMAQRLHGTTTSFFCSKITYRGMNSRFILFYSQHIHSLPRV